MSGAFEVARSLIWPALKVAGMLKVASTVLPGCTEATDFDVAFGRPDVNVLLHAKSTDYEIEYVHADAPGLREGAEVIVDGVFYRLRENPRIDQDRGADGYWRQVLLTEVR